MYIEAPGKRKPVGVLMIEHRLIERALSALETKCNSPGEPPDVMAFAELIDFFGTYADATHHGKEEDILFVDADGLPLAENLSWVLSELRQEHVRFRAFRRAMAAATKRLARGEAAALSELTAAAREFILLLRQHILKEDKVFFPGYNRLQNPPARSAMMARFAAFDAERLHAAYQGVVERNE